MSHPSDDQKKKRKRVDRSSRVMNYYNKIEAKRRSINDNLLKVLERVDLDRPILLKEKFDVLWRYDG